MTLNKLQWTLSKLDTFGTALAIHLKAHFHGTTFHYNCRTQHDDTTLATRIAPCKLTVQLAYDFFMQHEKSWILLKRVLKPYDNQYDASCV